MKCKYHPEATPRPVEIWEYYKNGRKLKQPVRKVVWECPVCKRECER